MVLGKVKVLAIYFDSLNENNLPAFSGGDLVTGRVVVEVTGDVRVKSLDITARGVAKVRWTESRNAGANTAYTQNYTEEVEYLHHYDTLIGEERDEDCPEEGLTVLHAGLHEFAFSFNLPQMTLATSFEGKHGSVRYWVKAELHRPWLLPVKVKKEFIVFEHIDINTPLLLAPQAGSKEKTLCCWFCASGPISLSAKIERKGYTPDLTYSNSLSLSLSQSARLIFSPFSPRRVDPNLRRGGELFVPGRGAQGRSVPDADLLRQGQGQADPATGVQSERRRSAAGEEPELGGQTAQDPPSVALHPGLPHHQGGVRPHGVRGRSRRIELVSLAAAGDRDHTSARLRHPHLQHQQQLQHFELAGPVGETRGTPELQRSGNIRVSQAGMSAQL
ncbi:arrestin domain-containing protein 3b isoform X2 [Sander vitreus]